MTLLILVTACGSGVSEEEFEAEQTRAQELEAEVQALQGRLDKGAAITEVLDTLIISLEEGSSAWAILELTALIKDSAEPLLMTKWLEISKAFLASSDPLPQQAFIAMGAAVQAAGDLQIYVHWQDAADKLPRGVGASAFLDFTALALAQPSGDPGFHFLQAALVEFFEAISGRAAPAEGAIGAV